MVALDQIAAHLAQAFELSIVTLWLDPRVPYIGELLHGDPVPIADHRHLRGNRPDEPVVVLPGEKGAPWLGQLADLPPTLREAFFESPDEPLSAAIVPIEIGAGVCAYMSFGSAETDRFTADMATDLLQRFAVFVSAGLVADGPEPDPARLAAVTDPAPLPRRVVVHGDFDCPWSYLAFRRAAVLAAAGVDIDWRAVEREPRPHAAAHLDGVEALQDEMDRVVGLLLPGEQMPYALAGFVPCAEVGIKHTLRCASPRDS